MIFKTSENFKSLDEGNHRKSILIGIGNEYRGDDSVGLLVVRKIYKKQLPSITVKEETGDGAALMEAWQGFHNVFIIDAVSSGAKPGMIFKIEANKEIVPSKFFHYSTHAFSVAEAVELARTMNMLPPKLLVYGIEGINFAAGVDISPQVKKAASQVIKQIVGELGLSNSVGKRIPVAGCDIFQNIMR